MDFEARLDRLTERHEALAQTVEITVAMQQTNEKQIAALVATVDRLAGKMDVLTGKVDILTERTIQAMDAITRLGRIAEAHESRLSDLEDGK
jgi:hypothetical protein